MNEAFNGKPDYPISFKNTTGSSIPAFSLIRSNETATINNARVIIAAKPNGNIDDGLFVTYGKAVDNNAFGKCRSTFDGCFWVKYTGTAPTAGDDVGAVNAAHTCGGEGSGFRVLYVDTTNTLLLCERITDFGIRDAELTATLSAATNFKTGHAEAAAKFLVRDPASAGDLKDGATFTAVSRWTDLTLASGQRIVVAWISGEWLIIASECP